MAIWGDGKIFSEIFSKNLVHNGDQKCIGPGSLDLRLGNTYAVPLRDQGVVRLGDRVKTKSYVTMNDNGLVIGPGEFILATTMEYVIIPDDAAAFVHGRSSIGRIGLTVQNAGFVDPGFKGEITLELRNDAPYPIRLVPGYRVAQLVYMDADGVLIPYSGKYQGQIGATPSMMYKDSEALCDRYRARHRSSGSYSDGQK